jgi:hypothetical protein
MARCKKLIQRHNLAIEGLNVGFDRKRFYGFSSFGGRINAIFDLFNRSGSN